MSTFIELSDRLDFLERKEQLFDLLKTKVEDMIEQCVDEDKPALNDVLLDLDEKCVAPIVDEISSIKGSSLTKKRAKTTEKKDVKAKKERKPAKKAPSKSGTKAKKTAAKSRGGKTNNTRKRSC